MSRTVAAQLISASFLTRYHRHTRSLAVSFLFILPLLVVYEMGMLILRPATVSWAGDVLRWLLHGAFGRWGALAFNLAVIVAIAAALIATRRTAGARRGGGVNLDFFPTLLAESLAYAAVIMMVVPLVIRYALPLAQALPHGENGTLDNLVLSVGAGIYEEIVFRLGLMSVIYLVVLKLTRESWFATVLAIFFSSVLFSVAHYLGGIEMPAGEFIRSFSFRTISGIIFAAIYINRGLAAACYTHAFYDVLVVVFR